MGNKADNLLSLTRHGTLGSTLLPSNTPSNDLVKVQGGSNVPRNEPFIKGATPAAPDGPNHGNGNVTPGDLSGDVVNGNDLVRVQGGGDGVYLNPRQRRLAAYKTGEAKYKAGVRAWWQNFLHPAPVRGKMQSVKRVA